MINDLAREWIRMGHDVEVVTQYPSYPQSYVFEGYENKGFMTEHWEGMIIHRFPFTEGYRDSKLKKFHNYYSFIRGAKHVVNSLKGDFDCLFVSQTGPLTVAYPALYAKKKWGIPVNIWTFDLWPDVVWSYGVPRFALSEAILNKIIRNIYRSCDRIFISSKRFKDTIGNYTDKECMYAPNWLRPAKYVRSSLRLPDDKINFTFTGNVSRYQNLVNTIEGFAKAGIENAQLNIVGDGSFLSEVKESAAGIEGVVFHGRKPYNEMLDILEQSQVLLLPLISQEGIEKTEPLKLQSYLQAGRPIYGVLNGAGRDIIERNRLGLCADPTDTNAIAEGFKNMVDFASYHGEDVAAKASKLMTTRFNKEDIVEKITKNLICS